MHYILTGFAQEKEFRVFTFECLGADRIRLNFKVRTDLALVRKYSIRLQELPLLCRGVLERQVEGEHQGMFTYTEADMCQYANDRATRNEVAQKRKASRRPPIENLGAAWRGSSLV